MPDDWIVLWNFELFEQDVQGVDAVVMLNDAARAGDGAADADLPRNGCTLNLLSLSSLKTNDVGPV